MLVVNDLYPGPLINAQKGDQVSVQVLNQADVGIAIHWHGVLQNGTYI